jgi:hypothetical protein
MATDRDPLDVFFGADDLKPANVTLRQWYIGMALQGAASKVVGYRPCDQQDAAGALAHSAILIADAAIELEGKDHD